MANRKTKTSKEPVNFLLCVTYTNEAGEHRNLSFNSVDELNEHLISSESDQVLIDVINQIQYTEVE